MENNSRSRLFASSDPDNLRSISTILTAENKQNAVRTQLSNYFTDSLFLNREWHEESNYSEENVDEKQQGSTWRLKERMKTSGVALVVCLNIGIDPPDIIKPNPCARKECWFDPTGAKQKGLEFIGNALQQQYEKWQSKAKYKQCLDPTSDELRKVCLNLRKNSKNDRLLLHYNGHGVPKPTKNGELWVFGKYYTHYTPVAICELRGWLGDPAIYVLDCSAAGVLISHLVDNLALKAGSTGGNHASDRNTPASPSPSGLNNYNNNASSGSVGYTMDGPTIVLAACRANEILPMNPLYPADLFTACLTTPITTAIRWFILQNPFSMVDVNPDVAGNIPGKDGDRKTPRGELNWIFTAITDTIAWTTLPSKTFQKMFRQDLLVASLFRNYLLAKRIMKSFNCTPQSWPLLPDTTTHPLWQSWDMTLEQFISHNISVQKGSIALDPRNNLSMASNLSFFTDQLTAFDLWLEFSTAASEPPDQLPVVLQALLSQTHRLRALHLLKKYLALGPSAVSLSLMVGIYPYILKLLQSPAEDIKQTLIGIWASIMGFDATCRQELIREKAQAYFVQFLQSKGLPAQHRCMAAFVLAELCNQHREGQQSCLHLSLHRICTSALLQPEVLESSALKKWICLCLYKLCEDFAWAKYLCITEDGHVQLYPLLSDPDPTVRTAAVLALGEIFGASTLTGSLAAGAGSASAPGTPSRGSLTPVEGMRRVNSGSFNGEERDLRDSELHLVWQLLDSCMDGSITVRLEAIYALSKCLLLPAHVECVKLVAKAVRKRNQEKKVQKLDKRTVSPSLSESGQKINFMHPWHLTPSETAEVKSQVEQFIESQNQVQLQIGSMVRSQSGSMFDRFSPTFELGMGIAAGADNADWLSSGPNGPTRVSPGTLPPGSYVPQGVPGPPPPPVPPLMQPSPRAPVSADTAWLAGSVNPTGVPEAPPRPNSNSPRSDVPNRKQLEKVSVGPGEEPLYRPPVEPEQPTTPSLVSLMATVYVRVWLALTEVQGKDPNSIVVNAAALIRYKIYALIASDEKFSPQIEITGDASNDDGFANALRSQRATPPFAQWAGSPFSSPSSRKKGSFFAEDGTPVDGPQSLGASGSKRSSRNLGSMSPVGPAAFPLGPVTPGGDLPPAADSSYKSGRTPYRSAQNLLSPGGEGGDGGYATAGTSFNGEFSAPPSVSRQGSFGAPLRKATSTGSIANVDAELEEDGVKMGVSRTYEEAKKQFLRPEVGFNPIDDPLSLEGANRAYRISKIQTIVAHQRHIENLFKDVVIEDKAPELYVPTDRRAKGHDDAQQARLAAVTNLPSSVTKFEEKVLLKIDNAVMTSLVMFHAFQDILAVSDESSVSIWSLANSSRIMEIKNKHSVVRDERKDMVKRINTHESVFTPLAEPRITAMNWINESYNSLLVLGSDDGVVKVWRDTSSSDSIDQLASMYTGRNSINGSMSMKDPTGRGMAPSNVELATAFSALPDIAETSKGSGLLLSWQQATGTLFAGGNSNTVRVWDLGREQCVRVFETGTKTCLTALATTVGAFAPSPLSSPHHNNNTVLTPLSTFDVPLAWTFAGFADGSIGVYDERVQSNGGRVHYARDHSTWIVSAHMRADAQEVITSSVRGAVKFWDIRSWRTYKTLDVQKSPLTSMSVHNCAPIIATGSHAQFIKILTFGGEQLGNIIKYHDGFLGQRMGPITSLTFHPHRMMLAASAADCIISIYATADDTHTHSS